MIEKYFYLIWTGIFFAIWLALFLHRKDVRKEMLFISVLFGFGGLLTQITHVVDWWKPTTITGTLLGFEDFFIGMFIGGVASVIYEEVYKKKVERNKGKHPAFGWKIFIFFAVGMAIYYTSFYLFNIHSFYSIIGTSFLLTIFMLLRRKDLWEDSLFSGGLMLVIGSVVYFLLFFILPDYFQRFWYLDDVWFATRFLGVPIAEYIWFFFAGAFIGPIYEFWQEGRLVKE